MSEGVCFEPYIQKDTIDCAIACVSIYLGIPYATVRAAVPRRVNLSTQGGLTIPQILRLAKRLGTPLKLQKDFDSDDCGMIDLDLQDAPGTSGHLALFFKGAIYTTANGTLWTDMSAYLTHHRYTLVGLLTRKDA